MTLYLVDAAEGSGEVSFEKKFEVAILRLFCYSNFLVVSAAAFDWIGDLLDDVR